MQKDQLLKGIENYKKRKPDAYTIDILGVASMTGETKEECDKFNKLSGQALDLKSKFVKSHPLVREAVFLELMKEYFLEKTFNNVQDRV